MGSGVSIHYVEDKPIIISKIVASNGNEAKQIWKEESQSCYDIFQIHVSEY